MQTTFKKETPESGSSGLGDGVYRMGRNSVPEAPARQATRRNGSWARSVHAFLGIVSALNLFVLITTGFLLQHAQLFRLDEKTVPRGILPSAYRTEDGPYGVRADIFVTDLHSGRLFGTKGALVLDGITLVWLMLLATGVFIYVRKQRAKRIAAALNGSSDEGE